MPRLLLLFTIPLLITLSCDSINAPNLGVRQLVFLSYDNGIKEGLYIINSDGTGYRRISPDTLFVHFRFECSPDGDFILFAGGVYGAEYDIYVLDKSTKTATAIASDPAMDVLPFWFRNGAQVVFSSWRGGTWRQWICDRDGGNLRQFLPDSIEPSFDIAVSPSGNTVALAVNNRLALYEVDASNIRYITPDTLTVRDQSIKWSPDGSKIAFLAAHPASGGPYTIDLTTRLCTQWADTGTAWDVRWSPDSRAISYNTYWGIYTVDLVSRDFRTVVQQDMGTHIHDWSPDGSEIAFDIEFSRQVYVVNVQGGSPRRATSSNLREIAPHWNHSVW